MAYPPKLFHPSYNSIAKAGSYKYPSKINSGLHIIVGLNGCYGSTSIIFSPRQISHSTMSVALRKVSLI
jgi:hypothetical protein